MEQRLAVASIVAAIGRAFAIVAEQLEAYWGAIMRDVVCIIIIAIT